MFAVSSCGLSSVLVKGMSPLVTFPLLVRISVSSDEDIKLGISCYFSDLPLSPVSKHRLGFLHRNFERDTVQSITSMKLQDHSLCGTI